MERKIFLIAGEPSGDALGAALMRGVASLSTGKDVVFEGIGGVEMTAQGLNSLTPMEDLCVMGLWEVLGHLPRLLRLINAVVEEIENRKPDILVTIDLPDFNFQVAKRLKARGNFKGKILHYVAPSVWAWRPKRAKAIAQFLDGLMCLFPFEPPFFTKEGLKARFVGHPLVELDKGSFHTEDFKKDRGINETDLCVGVFFGSREKELKTHAKIFMYVIETLAEQYPGIKIIVPTLPQFELDMMEMFRDCKADVFIETNFTQKWDAFSSCTVALAVSGTVGLELAYFGIPHVVAYKAHPLTAFLVKRMTKLKYVHLANILLDRLVVPEFLQGKCDSMEITKGVMRLIRYQEQREAQIAAFAEVQQKLGADKGGEKPSVTAAKAVFSFLENQK